MEKNKPKRKPGRPRTSKPKNRRFQYRMNRDDEAQLNRIASKLQTSKTFSIKLALNMLEKSLDIQAPVNEHSEEEEYYFDTGANYWEDEEYDDEIEEDDEF